MSIYYKGMRELTIPLSDAELRGDWFIPPNARGLVLFAHGSESSRKSPHNRLVARQLWELSLGTLLFDLLTVDEERQDHAGRLRFDVPFLAQRLGGASDWLREHYSALLPLGYLGACTGAAAALIAAAQRPQAIQAVVSGAGRPDLAGEKLARLKSPTLLIVGDADAEILALNRKALRQINGHNHLAIVAGTTHPFEEPGEIEQVAQLAGAWFVTHFETARDSRRA